MAIAQKLAGYSLGKADLLRRAMGKKKKEILDKEYVRFSDGHAGQRLLRRPRSRRCGTSSSRSPTTRSTRRTPPATAWSRTGPPTSRPTTRPSTWPRCSPGRRRQGQVGALPRRVPPDGHQGAAAGRQRVRRRLHPARHRHPLRPRRGPQRRRQRRRVDRRRPARRRAGSPTSPTSCARSTPVVCNKRTVESLIKAGAFDSLGHTRRGPARRARRARSTRSWTTKRNEAHRPVRPVRRRRRATAPTAGARARRSPIPIGEWDKTVPARLRAGDARPLRLRPPAVRRRARARRRRPTARSPRSPVDERADGVDRHHRRRSSPACSARSPSRATPGRSPPSRTSRARSR